MQNVVLDSTRFLIQKPEFVFIKKDKLEDVAKKFANQHLTLPDWNAPVYPEEKNKQTVDFFFVGNSINFAYTDFETKQKWAAEYKGKQWKGAYGMFACLKRAVDNNIPITEGEYLKDLTEKELNKIFEGSFQIPMFNERLNILREVGWVLCDKYDGHFYNLVLASKNRLFNNGKGIVERLTKDFISFDDSVVHNYKPIRFDKRAQLAPGMLYSKFQNQGDFRVTDIDELTVFADYVLPKGLRDLGVIEYEKSLANLVDSQQIILSGSRGEMEIRASTIHAAKMLTDRVNELTGKKINSLHMDYKLWEESRNPEGKPHHLCRTIMY